MKKVDLSSPCQQLVWLRPLTGEPLLLLNFYILVINLAQNDSVQLWQGARSNWFCIASWHALTVTTTTTATMTTTATTTTTTTATMTTTTAATTTTTTTTTKRRPRLKHLHWRQRRQQRCQQQWWHRQRQWQRQWQSRRGQLLLVNKKVFFHQGFIKS